MASKKTTSNRATASMWFDFAAGELAVRDVEAAFGKDTAKVYDKALDEAFATHEAALRDWFADRHRRTGRTAKAFMPGRTLAAWDADFQGYAYYRAYGYDKRKSCVPIFFEYGSPRKPPYHIEPEFVIYYVMRDSKGEIHERMVEAINEEWRRRQEASARALAGTSEGGAQA